MKHKIIMGALLSLLSNASFAQMTLDDVNRNLDTYDRYVPPQSEMDDRWTNFNRVPENTTDGQQKIEWKNMPSGSRCGNFVMSGGQTRALDLCQGYNPRYSCPPGFTRRDFGYFEAGGGARQYNWCTKN